MFIFTYSPTIMAVEFDGGVIVGSDTRIIRGHVVDTITQLSANISYCHNGFGIDRYAITEVLRETLNSIR